jgi:hypothetical protein
MFGREHLGDGPTRIVGDKVHRVEVGRFTEPLFDSGQCPQPEVLVRCSRRFAKWIHCSAGKA